MRVRYATLPGGVAGSLAFGVADSLAFGFADSHANLSCSIIPRPSLTRAPAINP